MTALIVSCHPDDMEFMMGGTALLLRDAGCAVHCINVANGNVGSVDLPPAEIATVRRKEAMRSADLLGAVFHESLVGDLEVFYTQELIRRITGLVRTVKPDIVLTQSLEDYMEDHMNTARLAVSGTFLRSVRNYESIPAAPPVFQDAMLYHATPHILSDSMRRPIVPELYVDVGTVLDRKEALLACHASQKEWLDKTQGFDSYLKAMRDVTVTVGGMSGRFAFAEGWRRHSHVGFTRQDRDPLSEVLGERVTATGQARGGMIMELLSRVIGFIFSFKAYVMLPAVILLVALAIRMNVGQSLMSALRLGVGFAGIFVAFDFFVQQIAPAVTALVKARGLDFPVLDVGWPPLAAITWASPIAPLTIVVVLALNLVLLALNVTRTVNIDIWNYWHFALVGALVQAASGSLLLGLAATALIAVYGIVVADWNAPMVERECGLKGISITTLSVNGMLPYGVAADKLIERIPGLNRISLSPRDTGTRFGILVEPMMIGVAIGALFGILAGYEVKRILELAINVAAVMFILPHCGGLIGKGMEPVSLRLKDIIQRRFPKKTLLYIGMDSGVIMQNPSVIVTGLLLMPISIGIAFILPGNRTLPLGDLANLISVMSVLVLATRGNVFRAVLIGIPIVVAYLLISTFFAPLYTTLAAQAGSSAVAAYTGEITAFTDGGNPVRFWFYYLFRGSVWAFALVPVVAALMYLAWRNARRLTTEEDSK